ncbi:MAG: hypothetical protein JMDDDDMK_01924 [Acidobacteria bacterium]|nr:hypothetical protein [Acidobacteriota bacterium]
MTLKSRDLIFIAIVVFVVGGLWYLSTRNKAMPMPPTPPHLTAKTREECLQCHLPAKLAELELQHKHPGKWRDERVNCTLCHKPPQGAKVQNPGAANQ